MYFDMFNDVYIILKTPRWYLVFGVNHTKELRVTIRLIKLINDQHGGRGWSGLKIYTQNTVKQKNI